MTKTRARVQKQRFIRVQSMMGVVTLPTYLMSERLRMTGETLPPFLARPKSVHARSRARAYIVTSRAIKRADWWGEKMGARAQLDSPMQISFSP